MDGIDSIDVRLLELSKTKRYYGDALEFFGVNNDAEYQYKEALEEIEQHTEQIPPDEETLVRGPIFLGLGQVYLRLNKLVEAELQLTKSESVNEKDPFFFAHTMRALGRLAVAKNDLALAERRFAKAVDMFVELGNKYYVNWVLLDTVQLKLHQNKFGDALSILENILQRTTNNEDFRIHRVNAYMWRAYIDLAEEREEKAVSEYTDAYRIGSEELDNPHLCEDILNLLRQQFVSLKESGQNGRCDRLYSEISKWRSNRGYGRLTPNLSLDAWFSEVERLHVDNSVVSPPKRRSQGKR